MKSEEARKRFTKMNRELDQLLSSIRRSPARDMKMVMTKDREIKEAIEAFQGLLKVQDEFCREPDFSQIITSLAIKVNLINAEFEDQARRVENTRLDFLAQAN